MRNWIWPSSIRNRNFSEYKRVIDVRTERLEQRLRANVRKKESLNMRT